MKKRIFFGLGVALILCASWSGNALTLKGIQPQAEAFEELRMHMEVDLPSPLTRQDRLSLAASALQLPAEVVLEANSQHRLARIRVTDSTGKAVLGVDCPSTTVLGVSEVALECEGITLGDTLREIPPGRYFVAGTTVAGMPIEGTVQLRGGFPGFFNVVSPLPGEVVPSDDVTISWSPSRGAARYVLEVEQDELGFSFEIKLPPWQTSFALPEGVLQSGETYEYSLAVQGDTDNELEVEGSFVTAPDVRVRPRSLER